MNSQRALLSVQLFPLFAKYQVHCPSNKKINTSFSFDTDYLEFSCKKSNFAISFKRWIIHLFPIISADRLPIRFLSSPALSLSLSLSFEACLVKQNETWQWAAATISCSFQDQSIRTNDDNRQYIVSGRAEIRRAQRWVSATCLRALPMDSELPSKRVICFSRRQIALSQSSKKRRLSVNCNRMSKVTALPKTKYTSVCFCSAIHHWRKSKAVCVPFEFRKFLFDVEIRKMGCSLLLWFVYFTCRFVVLLSRCDKKPFIGALYTSTKNRTERNRKEY